MFRYFLKIFQSRGEERGRGSFFYCFSLNLESGIDGIGPEIYRYINTTLVKCPNLKKKEVCGSIETKAYQTKCCCVQDLPFQQK